jgi:hypothetical protein
MRNNLPVPSPVARQFDQFDQHQDGEPVDQQLTATAMTAVLSLSQPSPAPKRV